MSLLILRAATPDCKTRALKDALSLQQLVYSADERGIADKLPKEALVRQTLPSLQDCCLSPERIFIGS